MQNYLNEGTIIKSTPNYDLLAYPKVEASGYYVHCKGEAKQQKFYVEWMHREFPITTIAAYAVNNNCETIGQGHFAKLQGVTKGVSDLIIHVENSGYRGICLEFKYGRNWLTPEQEQFLTYMSSIGFLTGVCYSTREAQAFSSGYLATSEAHRNFPRIS
jgi:hypothetical protein